MPEAPKPGPGPNAPNRDAPIGYHVNKDGEIVRNKGRQDGNRGGGAGGGPGGGGPGEGGPGGGGPGGGQPIPERFLEQLAEQGLTINNAGELVFLEKGAGVGAGELGTAEQLRLAQRAFERFGIASNPFYDPRRVVFTGDFRTGAGGQEVPDFINLGTGVSGGGTNVVSDARLEYLRLRTGYDPAHEFEIMQGANTFTRPDGSTYTASAFQTPEAFAAYQAAARANYQEMASGEGGIPRGAETEETTATFDPTQVSPVLDGFDTPTLTGLNETVGNLLKARSARERAQSYYGDYFAPGSEEF